MTIADLCFCQLAMFDYYDYKVLNLRCLKIKKCNILAIVFSFKKVSEYCSI